jgi:acetylornithine deacetylase/succinyl-diaminopimelate desuccinylase-like protein
MAGIRFYPIMVSEKRGCQLQVTFRGPGGHGSLPMRGGAMAKLGQVLEALDRTRLPVHLTEPVRLQLEAMRDRFTGERAALFNRLLEPGHADAALDELGVEGRSLDAVLHNTVNATIVEGGLKINVIPSEVRLSLDGRLLPGQGPEDLVREVRAIIGEEPEIEVGRLGPAQAEPDLRGFGVLADIIRELDPDGVPVPYLVSGGTDGRHFAKLGISTYGFTPVTLPAGFDGWATIHDADERIPAEALAFGSEAIFRAIQRL